MRQLFDDSADVADAEFRRAERQFFNSLTSKKGKRMNAAKEPKAPAIEAATEPRPSAASSPFITFGEVARLLGVALNTLTEWAQRGLLPSPQEQTGHPHRWQWSRDAMTRWCEAMQADMAKAAKSRL